MLAGVVMLFAVFKSRFVTTSDRFMADTRVIRNKGNKVTLAEILGLQFCLFP